MKKRVFSFILGFAVVAVTATAMNCGCAFAEAATVYHASERTAMGHCEQHAQSNTKSKPDECCLGCKLELGALNSQPTNFHLDQAKESFLPHTSSFNSIFRFPDRNLKFFNSAGVYDTRGVSAFSPNEPVFILIESLLI